MNLNHLTDEQFADLLAGESSDSGALLHVERCEACRQELASLSVPLQDLNFASLRRAEQRARTIEVPSRWALNWSALPGWGATMAAVLIFGVAVGAHLQTASRNEPALHLTHRAVAPSADELAQDNRLMRSIDSELSEQVGPQVPAAALSVAARADHRRSLREVSN